MARVIALGAALLTVLITARVLGPEGRGHVATFAVLTMVAATIFGGGTGIATYSLSASNERSADELAGSLGAVAVAVVGVSALSGSLLGAIGLLDRVLGPISPTIIILLAFGAGLQYLATSLTQLATGLGKAGVVALGFGLPSCFVMLATLAAAVLKPDAASFMAAQVAGWMAAAAALSVVIAQSPRPSMVGLRTLIRRARPAIVGDVTNALSYRLDVLLLGVISGPASVGVYSLATQALEPIWIIATSISNGLLLRLRETPRTDWARITARTLPVVLLLTGLGNVTVLALMPVAISLVGPRFDASQAVAVALAPAILFLAISKVLAAYNIASGRLGVSSIISAISLLITTCLDLLLLPTFGAIGAAVASSVGYGASMLLWAGTSRRWAARAIPTAVGP